MTENKAYQEFVNKYNGLKELVKQTQAEIEEMEKQNVENVKGVIQQNIGKCYFDHKNKTYYKFDSIDEDSKYVWVCSFDIDKIYLDEENEDEMRFRKELLPNGWAICIIEHAKINACTKEVSIEEYNEKLNMLIDTIKNQYVAKQ